MESRRMCTTRVLMHTLIFLLVLVPCSLAEVAVNYRAGRIIAGSVDSEPRFQKKALVQKKELEPQKPLNAPSGPALLVAFAGRCGLSAGREQYKICLFENATQRDSNGDDHLLGVWDSWEDDHMLYTQGDPCPNGSPRNLTLFLACAQKISSTGIIENNNPSYFDVVNPSEPSMCNYEATLRVPIACDLFDLRAAQDYLEKQHLSEEDRLRQELGATRSQVDVLRGENHQLRLALAEACPTPADRNNKNIRLRQDRRTDDIDDKLEKTTTKTYPDDH